MSTDALCRCAGHPSRRLFGRLLFAAVVATLSTSPTEAATFRTKNFVVHAPSGTIAKKVGRTAEVWRKRLAVEWLGKEMPQWYKPCPIHVKVGQIGAGGATTFSFDRGHVFGWRMRVQGSLQRILDSVIPHEVSHTVFACHFRRPLPRWADEGAATLVEHESEKRVQQIRLKQVINTRRRIRLRRLLAMKDYPRDMQQVLVLYAEGYALADFLVQQGGKSTYLRFLDDAYRNGWDAAIKRHYGFASIEKLEKRWTGWILAGSPRLDAKPDEMLASRKSPKAEPENVVIRSQTPARSNAEESPIAPAPRRIGHRTGNTQEIAAANDNKDDSRTLASPRALEGRVRTLNDGWVPIVRKRRRAVAAKNRKQK